MVIYFNSRSIEIGVPLLACPAVRFHPGGTTEDSELSLRGLRPEAIPNCERSDIVTRGPRAFGFDPVAPHGQQRNRFSHGSDKSYG